MVPRLTRQYQTVVGSSLLVTVAHLLPLGSHRPNLAAPSRLMLLRVVVVPGQGLVYGQVEMEANPVALLQLGCPHDVQAWQLMRMLAPKLMSYKVQMNPSWVVLVPPPGQRVAVQM